MQMKLSYLSSSDAGPLVESDFSVSKLKSVLCPVPVVHIVRPVLLCHVSLCSVLLVPIVGPVLLCPRPIVSRPSRSIVSPVLLCPVPLFPVPLVPLVGPALLCPCHIVSPSHCVPSLSFPL